MNQRTLRLVRMTTDKLKRVQEALKGNCGVDVPLVDLYNITSEAYSSITPVIQQKKQDGAVAAAEKQRAIEEFKAVGEQMICLYKYLLKQNNELIKLVAEKKKEDCRGTVNAVLQHKLLHEQLLLDCQLSFKSHLKCDVTYDTCMSSAVSKAVNVAPEVFMQQFSWQFEDEGRISSDDDQELDEIVCELHAPEESNHFF